MDAPQLRGSEHAIDHLVRLAQPREEDGVFPRLEVILPLLLHQRLPDMGARHEVGGERPVGRLLRRSELLERRQGAGIVVAVEARGRLLVGALVPPAGLLLRAHAFIQPRVGLRQDGARAEDNVLVAHPLLHQRGVLLPCLGQVGGGVRGALERVTLDAGDLCVLHLPGMLGRGFRELRRHLLPYRQPALESWCQGEVLRQRLVHELPARHQGLLLLGRGGNAHHRPVGEREVGGAHRAMHHAQPPGREGGERPVGMAAGDEHGPGGVVGTRPRFGGGEQEREAAGDGDEQLLHGWSSATARVNASGVQGRGLKT